ncbi:hypothetical protein LINPERHAP2_LOCUS14803, partial [Linum perenne]
PTIFSLTLSRQSSADCPRLPPTAPDCRRPPPCVRRRRSSQSDHRKGSVAELKPNQAG